jgi:hypothetical protein
LPASLQPSVCRGSRVPRFRSSKSCAAHQIFRFIFYTSSSSDIRCTTFRECSSIVVYNRPKIAKRSR